MTNSDIRPSDISTAPEAATSTDDLIENELLRRRIEFANSASTIFVRVSIPLLLLMVMAWLVSPENTQFLALGFIASPILAGSLLYKHMQSRGNYGISFDLFLLGSALTAFGSSFVFPNMLPVVGLTYIVIVLFSSVLLKHLNSRWVLVGVMVGFAINLTFSEAVATALFPPIDSTLEHVLTILVASSVLLTGSVLIRLNVISQQASFRDAQSANYELQERIDIERNQRIQLEQTEQRVTAEQVQREQMQALIKKVVESVAGLKDAAAEIQAAATQQVASTLEQETAINQTVATVEEVRATVEQTAERAQQVAHTASESVETSRNGQEAVMHTMEGMSQIKQRVEDIATNILALSERTQQISEIIDTVNGLAEQSKLLALNASIEAARAGEEGKGFAVVAMEVRQLAEQSREATARVRDILGEIQQATNSAVMVTEEGSKGAESGLTLVERAGEAIQALSDLIEGAARTAGQIAASTHQQTNGMDQLVMAMAQIKNAAAQTAASTSQTEHSVRSLIDMAQRLEETASLYR